MGVETQKETKPQESKPKLFKAKIAIVNGAGEILTLKRSQHEDTRKGEWDWPGGTFDAGEIEPIEVVFREMDQELPGTTPHYIRRLDKVRKTRAGVRVVSHLFAATAEFPADGIVFGPEDAPEHDEAIWVPPSEYPGLVIPNKYKIAVAANAPIFQEIIELIQNNPTLSEQPQFQMGAEGIAA
jgi:8-oxo-dGTP pyrophosphatase MutT (NUDIX family)